MIVEIGVRDLVIEKEPSLQDQGPEDDVVHSIISHYRINEEIEEGCSHPSKLNNSLKFL